MCGVRVGKGLGLGVVEAWAVGSRVAVGHRGPLRFRFRIRLNSSLKRTMTDTEYSTSPRSKA